MTGKLTPARDRILRAALRRFDNPSKRDGTWERVHGGRSEPAVRWLVQQGLIRAGMHEATDKYRLVYEVEITPAGRAALEPQTPPNQGEGQ